MTMKNWSIFFTEMMGFYPKNLAKHTNIEEM